MRFIVFDEQLIHFKKIRQQEVAQVILNLDVTWKKFLSCASSSATDFLSIEHLGMILDVLYKGGMI